MRRKQGGLRAIHLGCALCLAAPALLRVAEFAWTASRSAGDGSTIVGDGREGAATEGAATEGAATEGAATEGERAELKALAGATLPVRLASAERHVAVLQEELLRAQEELRAVGAATLPGRYRTSLADAIPISDPSSRRALWVALRDPEAVTSDGAAFWDRRLVGRVVERYEQPAVAKIQLLNDPAFRVRFRSGDVTGVLLGQATLSDEGDPLLKVRFVSGEGLVVGADVVTAGDDGVYPPGLWIGQLRETFRTNAGDPAAFVVCAVGFEEVWSKVRIAVDVTTRSVSALVRQGER